MSQPAIILRSYFHRTEHARSRNSTATKNMTRSSVVSFLSDELALEEMHYVLLDDWSIGVLAPWLPCTATTMPELPCTRQEDGSKDLP